jgi:ankyrin repeat protein
MAASRGLLPVAVSLLEDPNAEIDINAKEPGSLRTALHYCCLNGHDTVVEYLLEKGAKPNQMDSRMNTAFHFAAANGSTYTVGHLFKAKADFKTTDADGMTPLDISKKFGHTSIEMVLKAPVGR